MVDVARVILLHQNGLDPRSTAFRALKADHRLIDRDDSLGFSHRQNRGKSWPVTEKLIAERTGKSCSKRP
ncbi:MAG: hypothetical protein CMM01_11855 [Rhodopirellula sp.]|nr:hypothetical protein [Rhodopirellula sp.]OUX51241.1 MAG: hypothetical protein CBE43_04660 [Rhodopirellula sp. TMED283]